MHSPWITTWIKSAHKIKMKNNLFLFEVKVWPTNGIIFFQFDLHFAGHHFNTALPQINHLKKTRNRQELALANSNGRISKDIYSDTIHIHKDTIHKNIYLDTIRNIYSDTICKEICYSVLAILVTIFIFWCIYRRLFQHTPWSLISFANSVFPLSKVNWTRIYNRENHTLSHKAMEWVTDIGWVSFNGGLPWEAGFGIEGHHHHRPCLVPVYPTSLSLLQYL